MKRFFEIKETWVCEKNVLVINLTKRNKTHARTHTRTDAHIHASTHILTFQRHHTHTFKVKNGLKETGR